jgi:hypothetical protein
MFMQWICIFLGHKEGGGFMTSKRKVRAYFLSTVAPAVIGVASLATTSPALAQATCQGPGAPTNTLTQCLTAVAIPGNPLASFDISFVNLTSPFGTLYYLADRANKGVDILIAQGPFYGVTVTGFVGIKTNANGSVNNNISGPDGVTAHGKWVYAGDGDSTLKVMDLTISCAVATNCTNPLVASVSTGGHTRVDEMALTTDGTLLIAANNAEDPPFATLFTANGDNATNSVSIITKISADPAIVPSTFGLSLEQPTWDPTTKRFYTSMPIIANNPPGCNFGQFTTAITCHGGMMVVNPATLSTPTATIGAFDPGSNTGIVPLNACSPNGATVGPNDNLLLGCTPGNNPSDTTTLVINAATKNFANIGNITGSDEVWFNSGDNRYYLGASKNPKPASSTLGSGAVLGVVDGTSVLTETIPQSSNSHSVAAASNLNYIFVPQVCSASATAGAGCAFTGAADTNTTSGAGSATVGQLICGTPNGCVAVYAHRGNCQGNRCPP